MPLVLLRSRLQERLQDFIINFLKNIFTSVLAPQTAIASLGGPGTIPKENNCNKIKVKRNNWSYEEKHMKKMRLKLLGGKEKQNIGSLFL